MTWRATTTDGTKRSVIEHNLHILLLPGLHIPASSAPKRRASPSTSSLELTVQPSSSSTLAHPVLSLGGLAVPSPFHIQLRIISKLTFNEQGRISAHRDFWDARDLIGLVPGATAAQWVLTRLAAKGLATASWFLSSRSSRDELEETPRAMSDDNIDALGLLGVRTKLTQAPDTDLDSLGSQ
jgi:hypothetical protein